jgi:hypothetical protein
VPRYGDFAVLKLDQEPGSEVAQAASSTSLGSSRENKRANTFVSFDFSAASRNGAVFVISYEPAFQRMLRCVSAAIAHEVCSIATTWGSRQEVPTAPEEESVMVAEERLELSCPCERWLLRPVRLPIPPFGPRQFHTTKISPSLSIYNTTTESSVSGCDQCSIRSRGVGLRRF